VHHIQIFDNIIIVQEEEKSSQNWRGKCIIMKLDRENASAKVSHEFLFNVMEKIGFDAKFTQWVS